MLGKDFLPTTNILSEELSSLADTEYIAVGGNSSFYFVGTVKQYWEDIDAVNLRYEQSYWYGVWSAGESAVAKHIDNLIKKQEHERGEAYAPGIRKKLAKKMKDELNDSLTPIRIQGENKYMARPYTPLQTVHIKKSYYRRTDGEPIMRVYITDADIIGKIWLLSEYKKCSKTYKKNADKAELYICRCKKKYKGRYAEI